MLDLKIPEISSTAGVLNDGIVLGKVNQTSLNAFFSNVILSDDLFVIRRDTSGTTNSFYDVSTAAIADIADNFEPFGTTATFSTNDVLYVASERNIKELYFRISTSGVWAGTGFEVWDSINGETANRQLTNVMDNTNGFRASTGIYKLSWDMPAVDRVAFSPVPGEIAKRKWIMIKLVGLTSVTTAPKLQRMWAVPYQADIRYADLGVMTNEPLTNAIFTDYAPLSMFLNEMSESFFTLPFLGYGLDIAMYRKRAANIVTSEFNYLASDNTWKLIPDFVDTSSGFESGPLTYGDPVQMKTMRWTIPTDWVSKTLNVTMVDNTIRSVSGYFIRHKALAVVTLGPTPLPLARIKCRSFGPDNSDGFIKHTEAKTYKRVSVAIIGIPPTTDIVAQIINSNTGQGASFTIPANTTGNVHATLSTNLSFAIDEEAILAYISGGNCRDLSIHLL